MISIINYGMGNIGSLQNMVSKVGGTAAVVSTPEALAEASKIILPGVGHFDNAVRKLKALGLWSVLDERARAGSVPILCICLGAQLVTEGSEEGTESGLRLDSREDRPVLSFPVDSRLRIPHMGWNEVQLRKESRLFRNSAAIPLFYFVHSYYIVADDPSDVLTTSYYGLEFVSGIARGNITALQFHPEKSHKHGMNVIRNFRGDGQVLKTRVIPSLLIKDSALVKTVNFKNPKYVGDPINAIRIFNDKEVDELAVIDIVATQKKSIDYQLLTRISKEAFMPLSYGGGITTCDDIQKILEMGYEKVILNSKVLDEPGFVREASRLCGSQSLVVCVDATKSRGEYRVFDHRTRRPTPRIVADWCVELAAEGAGEILLQNVDREGGYQGYDTTLIASVCGKLDIPVIALGGAGKLLDFKEAVESGASAVAAGSMFIFHGPYKAVLITYPDRAALNELLPSGERSH